MRPGSDGGENLSSAGNGILVSQRDVNICTIRIVRA
jgi:hypothetical protein